ncbi:MAG: PhzF family phenazine biosynthesis protein [Actinobacteria bacterium]|nr:PhzF family phenazine biosynthesis protein [Actinomycetota bacterium]
MAPIRMIQVDAFTNEPFAGNPAAVVLFGELPDDATLQKIALEMNLSETAFPVKRPDGDWDLRWFTPGAEVDLATLGSAHALKELSLVRDAVTFHTRSGPLRCEFDADKIVMDFPNSPVDPSPPPADLLAALSNCLGAAVVDCGISFDVVAQLASPEAVRSLTPSLDGVAKIDTRAIIVTASGDIDNGPADFVSRVFAPRVGVNEDPVTGSAHTILAPWWAERLDITTFRAHQVSARGGRLGVKLLGDRVELTGNAVTVVTGTLHV